MKELWKNERSKAGISLGLWGVFILFVLILASCGGKKETVIEPEKKEIVIEEKIKVLLDNPISYKLTYEAKDNSLKRIFDVTYSNNEYSGYLEDTLGVTKFRCDKTNCFKSYLDHEEELEEYYFTDITDIFTLNNVMKSLTKESDEIYSFKDDAISYKVFLTDEKVSKVIIEDDIYKVTFDINYNN